MFFHNQSVKWVDTLTGGPPTVEDPACTGNPEIQKRLGAAQGDGVCKVTSDCEQLPFYSCINEECTHKDVFPQEPLEIAGIFVFGFIMALCTVAGIGGGGIAVSML